VAGVCGSDRRFMTSEPSSDRTDKQSKRLREAKPSDRSRGHDSTKRGRYPQPSCEAFGRGDRPDVPQRLCALAVDRAGVVQFFRGHRGQLVPSAALMNPMGRSLWRSWKASWPPDTSRAVPQGAAQRRGDGRAFAQILPRGRCGVCRQGAGENAGVPHRKAPESADWPNLPLDREIKSKHRSTHGSTKPNSPLET
jgi:hypothetical protein